MNALLSTSPLSSIDTVNAYLAAFSEHNIESALQYVSENAIWHIDGDPILKTVGIVQGKAAIRLWLQRFPEGFQPIDFKLEPLIDATPDVIAIGHFRHRVVSTNAIADGDFIIRFTTSNGQITRYQIFEDSHMLSKTHHSNNPQLSTLVNGVEYGWDDQGEGSTLVLLHGLFLDRTFWNPLLNSIDKQFRCVTFDMPGHGTSGWREGLNLNDIANDIALWIIENNINKVTLVGHSQGGIIALLIAAKYPQLLDKLVLVNTSARAESSSHMTLWRERQSLLLSLDKKNIKRVFEDMQKVKYASLWLQANPIYAMENINKQMKADATMFAHALDAAVIQREDICETLKEIKVNTIVLAGTEDIATPPAHGEEIARLLPNASYYAIEKAGHSIPLEMPEALVNVLTK
ncbi:alpha/beta fold hydrolase [Shewanella psychropiezotolerans]|uniref:Alpha/beta fold hydrolase n=1 Tax=Shewanella psychropiezotolerans TaxID=2593655 RepID=A0ABX5X589_9GAMM|nr:alpha/beta fold hydrolase [Shewanella psychropiezotolerans]QDO84426.1 alpha/beta fold hydrolase [Shewanella psychropiezotolerans]